MKKICLLFACYLLVILGCDNSGGGGLGLPVSDPALPAGNITGFTFTETTGYLQVGNANVAPTQPVGFFGGVAGGAYPFTFELVYGIGAADNAMFDIVGYDLIVGASALAAPRQYSVRVRVTGKEGGSFEKAITFVVIPPPLQINMVPVTAGKFQLGYSFCGQRHISGYHNVTLTRNFYMGRFQITQREWSWVMEGNTNGISRTPSAGYSAPAGSDIQELRPVEFVNWFETLVFANRLSMMNGRTPAYEMNVGGQWVTNPALWGPAPAAANSVDVRWDGVRMRSGSNGYRLPTEAQWEFAAKGGTLSAESYKFPGSNTLDAVAWHNINSRNGGSARTRQVGALAPNELGIHDMSGNVWEWVWNRTGLFNSGSTDPIGPLKGVSRVIRGGSFAFSLVYPDGVKSPNFYTNFRTVHRDGDRAYGRAVVTGFRIIAYCQD